MKTRILLKRAIIILAMLLCFETGFCLYQIKSGTAVFSRNLNLGNKFLLSQDYDNAIRAFSKAIEIDGMNADAYIGRGDAYKAKGDYVSAWADYEKAQELSGDTDILERKIGRTNLTIMSEDGEGIDDAAIKLNGNTHSYELITDSSGSVSEILFPEKYHVEIDKEDYESFTDEISAENGGIDDISWVLENSDDESIVFITDIIKYLDMEYASIREDYPNGELTHSTGTAPWIWAPEETDIRFHFWGGPGRKVEDNMYDSNSTSFTKPFDGAPCHAVTSESGTVFSGINESISPDEFISRLKLDDQYSIDGSITYETANEFGIGRMNGPQIIAKIPLKDADDLIVYISLNESEYVDQSSWVWIKYDR